MRNDSAEILFQFFLRAAIVSRFGMGRDVDIVRPVIPLPTTVSTPLPLFNPSEVS